MSSDKNSIYEQHVKPLSRAEQLLLLRILQTELNNGDYSVESRNILELHGRGKEIWEGTDPNEYLKELREEWDERVG